MPLQEISVRCCDSGVDRHPHGSLLHAAVLLCSSDQSESKFDRAVWCDAGNYN